MIGKLLLIRESGILSFYINQDAIEIDDILLSGFIMANYTIAKELNDSIDILLMKNNYKILFQEFIHSTNEKMILACFCHKYHINDGIKRKMELIFNKFFKNYIFPENKTIDDELIKNKVVNILNDFRLKELISGNLEVISTTLKTIINEEINQIYAYVLTSSTNNILFFDGTKDILKFRPEMELKALIEEYLTTWNIEHVPQGDIFEGLELIAGLDLEDFCNTNQKLCGLGINTSINLKEEPENELILYFFGKNVLMRQCVITVEENLREQFGQPK
ncbi:MAG: hypothetical protein GY870_05295 [archaeon]|nr:hypothetical protein [archaeon]